MLPVPKWRISVKREVDEGPPSPASGRRAAGAAPGRGPGPVSSRRVPTLRSRWWSWSMARTAVVGSLIAGRQGLGGDVDDDAERKTPGPARCVRSAPSAIRCCSELLVQGPAARTRKSGSPLATKSPTWGTSSITLPVARATATSPATSKAQHDSARVAPHHLLLRPGVRGGGRCGLLRDSRQELRIDRLDHARAVAAHLGQDAHGPEPPSPGGRSGRGRRRCCARLEPITTATGSCGHGVLDPSQHGQAVDEGEDHQAEAHPDGPMGQDRRR